LHIKWLIGFSTPPRSAIVWNPSTDHTTMSTQRNSLVAELERLATALGTKTAESNDVSLTSVAERIAKNLGVKSDEVALLAVSTRWRHLHFLVPEALKNVGFIPLSSNSALAARTARDSRPEIVNNFSSVRHATVFEGVKAMNTSGESIQKIISAPILRDGKVVGVIQVSRKGTNGMTAGPDFSSEDLGKVLAICKPLGTLLQHVAAE
jgi:GAF domain-containing protein